jgi:hypothetical protein
VTEPFFYAGSADAVDQDVVRRAKAGQHRLGQRAESVIAVVLGDAGAALLEGAALDRARDSEPWSTMATK